MTVRYLSADWFEEARSALANAQLKENSGERIRFGYTITAVPDAQETGEDSLRYGIVLDPAEGTAALEVGSGDGDVRFTMTYAVAHSVAAGEQNGSKAFLNGEVQLGGNVDLLIQRAQELKVLEGLLPSVAAPIGEPGASRAH